MLFRSPAGVEGAGREFKSMKASAQAQIKRNHAHYAANRSLYREASLRLAELLGDRLRPSNSRTMRGQKQGAIDAGRIWRFDKLEDPHVFKKPIELDEPDLAICMLLDASGSRTDDQPEIAAQAQVIATALERCGIPHMLYAFSSVRGYTVLREFGGSASAGPGESDSLLNCYAAGLNRDGLALRAAGELFSRSTATTRLLIVLTDGAPMDSETNATKPYNGKDAIDDTAQEVRALRARGINVAAIYNGEDDFFASARLIYGSELVRVSSPYLLAQTVARLIINTAHL